MYKHADEPLSVWRVGGNAHVSSRDDVVSAGYNWEVYAASINEESESGRESPDGAHRIAKSLGSAGPLDFDWQ